MLMLLILGIRAGQARAQQPEVSFPFEVRSETVDTTAALTLGLDPGATAGIDNSLGEEEQPPPPPSDVFDARLVGDNNPGSLGEGVLTDLRNGTSDFEGQRTHKVQVQPGPEEDSLTFSWDLPDRAVGVLEDAASGGVSVQMDGAGSYTLTNLNLSNFTITLTYQNLPPSASDDSYSTPEDQTLSVSAPGVLDNDSDPDGDPIEASVVSDVSNGSLTLDADGSLEYTPDAGFSGTDSFEYEAADDSSATDQATVTITVESDNTPPEVITPFPDDSVKVSSPPLQLVNLESVFRDPDGDSLSITVSSGNPSILSAEDQGQEFSLVPSTTGTTTVTLTASDGPAETSTDFSITVTPSDNSEDPSSRALAVVNTAGSETKTAFGDTDVTVSFSDVSGSGGVDVSRFDSAPDGTDGIEESNVSDYRLVIEAKESTDKAFKFGSSTEVRLPVSDFGGISDPTQVTVYKRPTPGQGTFSSVPTTVDENGTPGNSSDDILIAETSSFSEFALASNTEPLPVELTAFTARRNGETVRLRWRTASETNNAGFEVQHKQPDATGYAEAGFVESKTAGGTTSTPQEYRFEITDITPGTHQFRLRQVDTDGTEHFSKAVSVTVQMEKALRLKPPTPNPVRSRVRLRVGAREGGEATVTLYNVLGQRVGTLYEGTLAPGKMHTIRVGTSVLSRLSSGTYFVRLKAANGVKTRRITLLR